MRYNHTMRRSRITITVNKTLLDQIDALIDGETIRNRSHAIEYLLTQLLQTKVKKAVILAGGIKHEKNHSFLLPIQEKPALEHLIANLKLNGIANIIICISPFHHDIKDYFGNGEKFGVTIVYSEEAKPLQTGGALLKAKEFLDNEPFILINGDILTNLPLKDLIAFHKKEESVATVALAAVSEPESFGQLTLHGTKLVHFYPKSKTGIKSHLVNSGIYVLEPEIFNFFPKDEKIFFLEDVIKTLIEEQKVSGFVFNEQWFDIGSPKNYKEAVKKFKVSSG